MDRATEHLAMAELVLRRGVVSDAAEIAEVNVESWRTAFRGLLADEFLAQLSVDAQTQRFARILVVEPGIEVWVAVQGSAIIGYGTIGPERVVDSTPAMHELRALYLRPAIWRRGVGRQLHNHLLARLGAAKVDRAMLWVLEVNARARAFYGSLGWVIGNEVEEIRLGDAVQLMVRYERPLP